jgi:hypothetical protein
MKTIKNIILALIVIAVGGFAFMAFKDSKTSFTNTFPNPASSSSSTVSALKSGGAYANNKYNFSVNLPEGFSAREIASNELGGDSQSESVVFENGKGEGIQIVITPFDDIKVLTADMIKADIPDMKIDQVQTVDVGQNYKGIAFISNAPEFGGSSREVWFVFKGNLYQISTYTKFDTLLQQIFSTWQFK